MSDTIKVSEIRCWLASLRQLSETKQHQKPDSDYHECSLLGEALGMEKAARLLEEALAARGITETKQ